MKTKITIKLSVIILLLLSSNCNVLKTALYDQYSYEKITSLKIESLHLISQAEKSYSDYKNEINLLQIEFEKLSEYEKNKLNNEITYEMVKLINNPEKNLYGGFIKRWKEKNTLSLEFINESKLQIEEAYDLLIKYEMTKDKKSITNYLNQ